MDTLGYITPVMHIDPTGEFLENVLNWITSTYEDMIDWLNSLPMFPFVIPSLDEITSILLSGLGGTILGIVEIATAIKIKDGFRIFDFKRATTGLNQFSSTIGKTMIIIPLVFDIGNAITANNGNSIWKRFAKSGIIIVQTGVIVLSARAGAALCVAGLTGNPLLLIAGPIVIGAGLYVAYWGSNKLYDILDIE